MELSREQTRQLRQAALATRRNYFQADADGNFALEGEVAPWSVLSIREL